MATSNIDITQLLFQYVSRYCRVRTNRTISALIPIFRPINTSLASRNSPFCCPTSAANPGLEPGSHVCFVSFMPLVDFYETSLAQPNRPTAAFDPNWIFDATNQDTKTPHRGIDPQRIRGSTLRRRRQASASCESPIRSRQIGRPKCPTCPNKAFIRLRPARPSAEASDGASDDQCPKFAPLPSCFPQPAPKHDECTALRAP